MMKKVVSLVFFALAVFVGTCSAENFTYSASYVMRNPGVYPYGYVTGTLYYHLDNSTLKNSRVRFETNYKLDGQTIVNTELYHYGNQAIYTICDVCKAASLTVNPEEWGRKFTDRCTKEGDFYRCIRDSYGGSGVAELLVKGTLGKNDYQLKFIKFNDGRELDLTNLAKIQYSSNKEKFELQKSNSCPEPECRSYVDIVFILDSSSSVNDAEWGQTKNFVKKAVKKFTTGPNAAYIGVIDFSAPDKTCGNSWYNTCCHNGLRTQEVQLKPSVCKPSGWNSCKEKRFIDDCIFDEKCNNVTDNTAKVLVPLNYTLVADKIDTIEKMTGHTCQRYGLRLAYDMLFVNNPRCKNHVNCPTPIVIVVTDGEDLCHTSTKQWAEIIKAEDDRGILLEVGVGLESDFDEQYLKELSSNLTGYEAALSVDNYDQIETVLDRMITPVCEIGQMSSTCGISCHGFCACSRCVCPMCFNGSDSCSYHSCSTSENGCQEYEVLCNDRELEETQCYNQWCDHEESDPTKHCKYERKNCTHELEQLGHHFKQCQYVECVNKTGGCDISYVAKNNTFCQQRAQDCFTGKCDPDNSDRDDGCVFEAVDCSKSPMNDICQSVYCFRNQCVGQSCDEKCSVYDSKTHRYKPRCEDQPCMVTYCNESDALDNDHRCQYSPVVCEHHPNNCMEYACIDGECQVVPVDKLRCFEKSDICATWSCDANAANGTGACVAEPTSHTEDVCMNFTCTPEKGWVASPKCVSDKACKIIGCDAADGGSCYENDVSCVDFVNLTDKCFQAACKEPTGCYKKQYRGAYFDMCGRCIREDAASGSVEEEDETDCAEAPEEDITTEGLAAAAIALIVLGAIIIGAAVALSGFLGTKALINRARGANNQSVVSNPLFEDADTEMTNPAFIGDTI